MDEQAIKHALQLIDQGHIEEGGSALVCQLGYTREEDGWAWLYSCVKTEDQKIYCAQKILKINPSHQKAKNALLELQVIDESKKRNFSPHAEESKTEPEATPDSDYRNAIHLIKAGRSEEGRHILAHLVNQNPAFEDAWWWLYYCVSTDEEKIDCLKQVVSINPNHAGAKSALARLDQNQSERPAEQIAANKEPVQLSLPLNDDSNVTKQPIKESAETTVSSKDQESPKEKAKLPKSKIKVAFMKPTVIYNSPEENLFAKNNKADTYMPDVTSGMYGMRLIIRGVSITSLDHPYCVEIGRIPAKSKCAICGFFAYAECPLRRNIALLHDAKTLFAQNKLYRQEFEERRQLIIEAIFNELKEHGRPLHYEIVFRIVHDRHPNLRLNPRRVLQFMTWHPDKFEWIDRGVFKAK